MGSLQSIGLGAIVGIVLAIALLFYINSEKKSADTGGYNRCQSEHKDARKDAVKDNLKAREQQDEIRQNRPGDDYYIDRWLHGMG